MSGMTTRTTMRRKAVEGTVGEETKARFARRPNEPSLSDGLPPLVRSRSQRVHIGIVTPMWPQRGGNTVTALRWATLLGRLGHRVTVRQEYEGHRYDVLIALHARRSLPSIRRFHQEHPDAPLIVALTGTDVYRDLGRDPEAEQALRWAWRIVVLQPLVSDELPDVLRDKVRVIYQSAQAPRRLPVPPSSYFRVLVLANLRSLKDPLRAARAARCLPPTSKIRVIHYGVALDPRLAEEAKREMAINPRYRWLGDVPHGRALRALAGSHLLVLSSHMEGGANVLSEAIATSTPVISSRIPGSVGILAPEYPGFFPVGDTEALAGLLRRAETDAAFYLALKEHIERLKPLVDPERERQAWASLLAEATIVSEKSAVAPAGGRPPSHR